MESRYTRNRTVTLLKKPDVLFWITRRKTSRYYRKVTGAISERLREPASRTSTLAILGLAGSLGLFLLFWIFLVFQIPSVNHLRETKLDEATIAYSSDGRELTRYAIENRTWVTLEEISPNVIDALIATEDRRFYKHSGIDPLRLFGAVVGTAGGEWQGGSTITMQLVRNLYPQIRENGVVLRKVKEWFTALRLEDRFTKDEILELYLNAVPFMYGAVGIEAGARTYFQKSATQLDVLESATLVGMLKATVYYNPQKYPERSRERRNVVLEQMVKYGKLKKAEYQRLRTRPTILHFSRLTRHDNLAPYFAEYVRRWLDEWAEKKGYNLYTDGLRVYTTVDSRLQRVAEVAVGNVTKELQAVVDVEWSSSTPPYYSTAAQYQAAEKNVRPFEYFWTQNPTLLDDLLRSTERYRSLVQNGMNPDDAYNKLVGNATFIDSLKEANQRLEAGFVAIEPHTGYVKVWVGGRNFREDEYDHVMIARRQPGSTFKPFVYAAALENGFSPYSVVADQVAVYRDPHTGQTWAPKNFGGSSGGYVSLRQGLAHSKNTVTAQLITRIGPDRVVKVAHQMGIASPLQAVPSLGLGTSEVSLFEMTSAYTAFANLGVHKAPIFITRIEDRNGKVIARFVPETHQALPEHVAYAVLDMMRGVVDYGTGVRLRSLFKMKGDLAGKTGTTQNAADGWFMLLHPNLVMGSWVGFNSPSITFRSNYWGQGAHTALHVTGNFYNAAYHIAPTLLDEKIRFKEAAAHRWTTSVRVSADDLNRKERETKKLGELLKRIREEKEQAASE